MKAKLISVTGVWILILIFGSCEKDELETQDFSESFNNGMIKSYSSEAVLKWNNAILVIDDLFPPPAEAKIYTMVTLAMHDALNNIVPKYETYALNNSSVNAKDLSKKNISHVADAAVAQAAHDVLIALYPSSTESANDLLSSSLAAITNDEYKQKGIEIGQNAASAILTKRQNDIPLGFSTYNEGSVPGTHQSNYMPWLMENAPIWPANAVYASNLAQLTPFGIKTSNQFRARPPYAIDSPEYTADYEETNRLGCTGCTERTAEQTQLGTFWIENLSSSMNRIGRLLAVNKNLNGWETARLLAITQMAQIDAIISSFEGKYHYKYWRPITAIRAGDSDGNDNTSSDLAWTTDFVTPPTPEYPSTHAETGGAAAEVFKLFFGTDNISFSMTSPYYLPGVEKDISSFSQVANEAALSRIYIGYHFRNAVEQGLLEGRKLGKYVYNNNLREL
ncbi:vanadium-dependent haloperoxidase [Arenibacter sp. F26102]|uniref:vanadium-dependent haloperoxidase n=1 Tax=Arenibacter sp. F26102 TaxID=2926416 RepID=UPI001FF3D384|nr:vanadium-dependent haloperoxidase [Arenibacter sp. F26102]MCK0146553.1 vanadium-dependent haloperoxidase [Arenibacter sp. F26102]